jgi:exo-1,4-beta-D-glucosaminidase
MLETFGRNKHTSTGGIQWMLHNVWPSIIWHLDDYYLRPGGSYFGAKKACEPLHVQYSYDDRSVVVVSSYYRAFPNMRVRARVLNLDLREMLTRAPTATRRARDAAKATLAVVVVGWNVPRATATMEMR